MTSPVSLTKTSKAVRFNPWAHSFWLAVREGTVITALSLLVYLLMFGGSFLNMLTNAHLMHVSASQLGNYYLFSPQFAVFLPPVLIIAALAQGLIAFRFLFRRSASNVWFSLGISRNDLFWSRFTGGAASLLAPIIASMAVILALNLSMFPNTWLILGRWLQMTAGLCVQALVFYAVAAAVCAAVGTVTEGLVYSFIALCLPSALLAGMNVLMVRFLFGFGVGAPHDPWAGVTPKLVENLLSFNPPLFLGRFIIRYAADDFLNTTQVSALPIAGWFVMAAVIALLGLWLFRTRRAETSGVLGGNKTPGFAAIFVVAFFTFSIPQMLPYDLMALLPAWAPLPLSCLAAAIVFFILAFPLRLLGRANWKGLLALPAGLAAIFAVIGVLVAGGLGYSAWAPDASDVDSVTISYNGIPAYVSKDSWGGGGSALVHRTWFDAEIELASKEDIAAVVGIQQAFARSNSIMAAYNVRFSVVYRLKDGRTVSREYQKMDRALMMKMLAIDGLEDVKKEFHDYICGTGVERRGSNWPQSGDVYLSSRFLDCFIPLGLDEAKRGELVGCIADDVAAQSVTDRYFPAGPEVCILYFPDRNFSSRPSELPDWSDERVFVTQEFTRTVAFLERNGFMDRIKAGRDVDYLDLQYCYYNSDYLKNYNFFANLPLFTNQQGSADALKREKNLISVTDAGQAEDILRKSHAQYLDADGGYIVYIHFKGTDTVSTAFLPMKDAPDFVKEAAK